MEVIGNTSTYAQKVGDSLAKVPQLDIGDVVKKMLHKKTYEDTATKQKKLIASAFPAAGYSLQSRLALH